jgi:hypothetical protein
MMLSETKYHNVKSLQESMTELKKLEKWGNNEQWLTLIKDKDLARKLKNQQDRVFGMVREEEPEPVVEKSAAALLKGYRIALQQITEAASPKPSQTYMTGMLGVHKVRVYENRGAIPDDDGAGGVACVALTDLLEFFPQDVIPLLTAFPGASVTKLLDGRPAVREGEKKTDGKWADFKDDLWF